MGLPAPVDHNHRLGQGLGASPSRSTGLDLVTGESTFRFTNAGGTLTLILWHSQGLWQRSPCQLRPGQFTLRP